MKKQGMLYNRFRGVIPILVGVLAVVGLLINVQPAAAQTLDNGPTQTGEICMQKVFGTPVTGSNKLNCTANDVRISRALNVSQNTCTRGTRFNLTATFEIEVNANARYDTGFFFRTDGGSNARGDGPNSTGECSLSALVIPPPPNPPVLNLDNDTCGDLNSGKYRVQFTIPNVLCQDTDGEGNLNLPNCTSWHSNSSTPCAIENAADFHPETKSKCVCDDTFNVPVKVEIADLVVEKSASPEQVPEPGGEVTYTVKITNIASVESLTINSITDDLYGDVCSDLLGYVLAPKETVSCSFIGSVSGKANATVTDVVEVCGKQSGFNSMCRADDAKVTITDVWKQPTLNKTAQLATNCQMDVTYQIVVNNNSEFDTLVLNSLIDDKFGDITRVHDYVVSTGCAVPFTINPLGNYTCTFVGRIFSPNCSTFTHNNTVTASVLDDDNVASDASGGTSVVVNAPYLP